MKLNVFKYYLQKVNQGKFNCTAKARGVDKMPTGRKYALSSADAAPNTAPILLKGDVSSNIIRAAALGYQGIEVHMRETARLEYDEIKKTSDDCGVAIAAVVTGRLYTQGRASLTDDRPYVTDSAMKGMRTYISIAAHLGSDIIIGWAKGKVPEGACRELYLERLAQNLETIGHQAKEQGVKVFLEVINRYETNIFTTAKETVEFIEAWGIPNSYVHLDTFHMNIDETDPLEAIRLCGKKLGYFHLADNTRCYPGSGTLNFGSYLSVLDEIGYDGYLSVECLPQPDGDTAAKMALEHLRQL